LEGIQVKVILIREWMGRTKGTELNLVETVAEDLIRRGTAKPLRHPSFRDDIADRQQKASPVEK
jgi:hypothetical protein